MGQPRASHGPATVQSSRRGQKEIREREAALPLDSSSLEAAATATATAPTTTAAAGFEAFWLGYPNKANEAAARQAWREINPDEPVRVAIMNGLAVAKRSKQWVNDGGGYIPFPAKWLTERRWENRLEVPRINERSRNFNDSAAHLKAAAEKEKAWEDAGRPCATNGCGRGGVSHQYALCDECLRRKRIEDMRDGRPGNIFTKR